MAKTDNLTDFLTGVAGAIRTKKGTTALINPQDFESEIGSIDTAKPEQTKTLTVTENGTQTVKPDTGKVLSGVTVTTNVPATPTEEKTVDLAMASGNQVVTPASGKHLTKVTITKPATLAAGNIKSGVNIGGVTGTLSPAKPEQAKTVDLAMASGNQVVSPDSGKVLSGVTITKPATLVASNIKKGVTIGGVAGSLSPAKPEQSKDVGLDMASGSQVVEPDTGKVLSSVTIYKPTTMTADNIKKGVNIGGVVGTMEAGGGSSNKLVQVVDGTITQVTAKDLAGATQIRSYSFRECSSLTRITIPDGVTSIGIYAFEACSSLTSVIIPEGVTTLGLYAFYNCSSLTSITIPDSVTSIGGYSLRIGSSTNKAVIRMKPTTPPQIKSSSFDKNNLEKIIVPKGTGATYKAATNWSALASYIQEATT
jgi:hypothetical protein